MSQTHSTAKPPYTDSLPAHEVILRVFQNLRKMRTHLWTPVQYSQTILIAAGAALFIFGLVLGALLGRRSAPAAQRQREAELKLDQVLQDKKAYEDEVVEHFSDTATLLNNLTESYRDVHNHLAKGAEPMPG